MIVNRRAADLFEKFDAVRLRRGRVSRSLLLSTAESSAGHSDPCVRDSVFCSSLLVEQFQKTPDLSFRELLAIGIQLRQKRRQLLRQGRQDLLKFRECGSKRAHRLQVCFQPQSSFLVINPDISPISTGRAGAPQRNRRETGTIPIRNSQAREPSVNHHDAFHCCIFCRPPTHFPEYADPLDNGSCRQDAQLLGQTLPSRKSNTDNGYQTIFGRAPRILRRQLL